MKPAYRAAHRSWHPLCGGARCLYLGILWEETLVLGIAVSCTLPATMGSSVVPIRSTISPLSIQDLLVRMLMSSGMRACFILSTDIDSINGDTKNEV